MLDDFFIRALLAGIGVALVAGPLGCFVIWRRMAYYGDTVSHSALLGVSLALVFAINTMLAVFLVVVAVSIALLLLQRMQSLSSDALLGLLAHASLALGLVILSFMSGMRVDLLGFLFGDILAVSTSDIAVIYAGGVAVLGVLLWIWRPLFAATVSVQIAQAEGLPVQRVNFIFTLLLATVIAIAIKIVGVLLITALFIIPAATARRFALSPESMAVLASILGGASVVGGLFGSLKWDTPSGPSIVVAALLLFVVSLCYRSGRQR